MAQSLRNARRQKIEPLSYTEAAAAPALKGMTSFLDITPEECRSQRFGMEQGRSVIPNADKLSAVVSDPGPVSSPGSETAANRGLVGLWKAEDLRLLPARRSVEVLASPSPESLMVVTGDIASRAHLTNSISEQGKDTSPEVEREPGYRTAPAHVRYTGMEPYSPKLSGSVDSSLIPGRGRSKVRRCVLAQDGHSLGEEAIYQLLWRLGRPESTDPNGSRTIRSGAAEIGVKINMAKKNVRQNISRLFEKLSLEILEDFNPVSSQARLYRIFSYKQILERRRESGLDYVLRNKGVVFCTKEGDVAVLSPAYETLPGDETYAVRPALAKSMRQTQIPSKRERLSAPNLPAADPVDIEIVSRALSQYWPVDQAAAEQLLRDCRTVRPDARADEIAFFVSEKVGMAKENPKILNPTGLVLTTVPPCFKGAAFEQFRDRQERRAAADAERAADEAARERRNREDMARWAEKEEARLSSLLADPLTTRDERSAAQHRLERLRDLARSRPA